MFAAMLVLLSVVNARLMFMEMDVVNSSVLSHQLDNYHVVMVGDSLRYQYLSLVYLAQFGLPYENTTINARNIVVERTFNSWSDFYITTNEMFSLYEYCECYRDNSLDPGKYMYENRYYYNKARNLSISYIQYFGDHRTLRGHWQPSDNGTNHIHHSPDHASVPFRWEYAHVDDAIVNIATKLQPRPSVLLLNAGHWSNKWNRHRHRERVFRRILPLFDRVVWKTTNYRRDHSNSIGTHDDHCAGATRFECLDLSWTKYLSESDYWDDIHLQAPIYSDINIQFIHQLVSGKPLYITPLDKEYYEKVVVVRRKRYLVDALGILRPVNKRLSFTCSVRIMMHTQLRVTAHNLTDHLLGDPLPRNCTL